MAEQEQHALTVIEELEHLQQVVGYCSKEFAGNEVALIADIGKGAIRFAMAAFPGANLNGIYAQRNERESTGRGPHFDIYDEGLHKNYPWLAVYNVEGTCTISAAILPEKLAEAYTDLYPVPDEAAHTARRHFGALVLESATTEVYTGTLKPDTGLVLPQRPNGPHIIHEVVPQDREHPGSFIKIVAPKNTKKVLDTLAEEGFLPIDELLTQGVIAAEKTASSTPPAAPHPSRSRVRSDASHGLTRLD